MAENKKRIQIIWGAALLLAGIGIFFRVPYVMPRIETFAQFAAAKWFIIFCFYFMGVLLIYGGIKKIKDNMKEEK